MIPLGLTQFNKKAYTPTNTTATEASGQTATEHAVTDLAQEASTKATTNKTGTALTSTTSSTTQLDHPRSIPKEYLEGLTDLSITHPALYGLSQSAKEWQDSKLKDLQGSTKENVTDTEEQISTDYAVALSIQEQDVKDLIKDPEEDADDEASTGSYDVAAIYATMHSNARAQVSTQPMTATDSAATEDPRDTDYSDMPALGPGNPFAALQSDGKEEANEEPHSTVEPEANKDAKQEAKESTAIVPHTSSSTVPASTDTPTSIITYASVAGAAANLPAPHPIFKTPAQFRKVLSRKDKCKLKKEEKRKQQEDSYTKERLVSDAITLSVRS